MEEAYEGSFDRYDRFRSPAHQQWSVVEAGAERSKEGDRYQTS